MKTALLRLAVVLCLFASSAPAFAWSGPGHMIVAAWAYQELPAADRLKLDALLKKHPRYPQWKSDFPSDVPGLTLEIYAVMAASLYPDQIRDHNVPATHPNWHFVDYPIRPPSFPMEGAPTPKDDVLFGIGKSAAAMRDTKLLAEDRAVMASFLIHLVGDVHQPLHCATLFNGDFHPPEGDRGGNLVFIKAHASNTVATELHAVWDGQYGTGKIADKAHVRPALNKANAMRAATPRTALSELTQHTSAKSWSLESRLNAIHDAYLDGTLHYGLDKNTTVVLPSTYAAHAKPIADHRIALAAYRLADSLHRALK